MLVFIVSYDRKLSSCKNKRSNIIKYHLGSWDFPDCNNAALLIRQSHSQTKIIGSSCLEVHISFCYFTFCTCGTLPVVTVIFHQRVEAASSMKCKRRWQRRFWTVEDRWRRHGKGTEELPKIYSTGLRIGMGIVFSFLLIPVLNRYF